jgi:hypothetical protein
MFWCSTVDHAVPPKIQTIVHQIVISKVVECRTLYNFYKGSMGFRAIDFACTTCQD